MKILLLANKGSNHAKKCAEGLADKGHQVVFVSPNDKVDKSVRIGTNIELITLKYGGKKGYLLNALELRRLYLSIKPDVVNVHYASGCGLLAQLAGVRPTVLSCYGSDIFEFPHLSRLNDFLLKFVLRHADALASTSYAMADEVKRLIGDGSRKIAITPYGVDTNLFKPMKSSTNERPVIGIVKSLLPIYDIPLLIRAFAIVHSESNIDPQLWIYGDGPMREQLEQMVSDLGLEKSVQFKGRIPNGEVPKVINRMEIFVNCSKQESFGVNVLEAMACEIPVIATDCVGPRELIEDGISGLILKDRTPESLALQIMTLLQDDKLRKKLGHAGRERVLERYNWEENIKDLEKVLKDNSR